MPQSSVPVRAGRPTPSLTAVFAHYDPHGRLSTHARRHLVELRAVADRVVVVTTGQLRADARASLPDGCELIERANEGYDFYSWRTGIVDVVGLDRLGRPGTDHLIITNDSVVGPLRPYATMLEPLWTGTADVWAATTSKEREPHAQSFCLAFGPAVTSSVLFHEFWRGMAPLSDRSQVIERYELGLSRMLLAAGFRVRAGFVPTAADVRVARARRARAHVESRTDARNLGSKEERGSHAWHERVTSRAADALAALGLDRTPEGSTFNPMIALWDRSLGDARLPFVKIETLRDDPYDMGREHMLGALERAHPAAFQGVRDYLRRVPRRRPERATQR